MPRMASMWAFIVSSIRRTSAWSTIADSPADARRPALAPLGGVGHGLLVGPLGDATGPRRPTDRRALFIIVNM